jgi:electron transport complex protein RnfC
MAFYRGIGLVFEKKPAILLPTAELSDVGQVVLPYAFPTEAAVTPAVSLYDTVRPGSPLARAEEDPTAVMRSSVTGVVSGEKTVNHPLYGELRCAVIDCPPVTPAPEVAPESGEAPTRDSILAAAEAAGVIDELDGVPLLLKLREWAADRCDFIVGDGVEVQPFASSAYATLRGFAEQVVGGLELIATCVGANGYHVAACLSPARRREIIDRIGKHRYYQAHHRYPVKEPVSRRAVGRRAVVRRVGVQACLALYRAVKLGESHTHAILTVAGDGVKHPQNVRVPFGTSVQEVLRRQGVMDDPAYLILGDSMTGTASLTQDIPVLPGMTCLLAFSPEQVKPSVSRACIGCGVCAQSCHAGLLPFEIYRRFENMQYERISSLRADECDGCGVCTFVCPCGLELAATVQEAKRTGNTLLLDLEEESDA